MNNAIKTLPNTHL